MDTGFLDTDEDLNSSSEDKKVIYIFEEMIQDSE